MKKIYQSNAERQKAFRERKKREGLQTITLMVPDDIYTELSGKPAKLISAYLEWSELKKLNPGVSSSEDHNKLQASFDILKAEHEKLKTEYEKIQEAYTKLKFGDWYSRK